MNFIENIKIILKLSIFSLYNQRGLFFGSYIRQSIYFIFLFIFYTEEDFLWSYCSYNILKPSQNASISPERPTSL